MNLWPLILLFVASLSYAQDQLALRLNENGMMKVMQMALKYNTGEAGSRTVVIPQDLYQFTIKQKDLAANPVVNIVTQISDLDLSKDMDFYLSTSDIKFTGTVDPKSLSTVISNSHAQGFDLKISVNLTKVNVSASSLSLCENKVKNQKKCGSGLKTTIKGLKIATLNKPIKLSATMRLNVKQGMATVKVLSVSSNLETSTAPTLNINFSELIVPRIAVVINGQETELDTSNLKAQILERKSFLGKKLMAFAGDFIASDMAEMLNVYLKNTQIATSIEVYNRDSKPTTFDEIEYKDPYIAVRDNTYVRPPIRIESLPVQGPVLKETKPANDVMKVLMDQFTAVIRQAQVALSLKKISTPSNKDVQLSGLLNFVLNHTTIKVKNTLGNSSRTLPVLDLSPYRGHDVNLAISEPVINGALDLVHSTGLFNELLLEVTKMDALTLNSLKLHFTKNNSFKAVANAAVDLKKIRTSFWKDPLDWASTGIGTWLERNNNNSVIYFPLEIEVIPVVVKDEKTGGVSLSLKLKSAFSGDTLINTYGYPSNVGDMYKVVRKGVISKLKEQLDDYSNKTFKVDLTKFLNQSGVEFLPKSIVFSQAAYMLLNIEIKDIKFNSKNPTQK